MQAMLSVHPSLNELYNLIERVPKFPFSNQQLVTLAEKVHAPKNVIKFYQSFGRDQVFEDKDDLTSRTEQVDIMRREEAEMPKEQLLATEEY